MVYYDYIEIGTSDFDTEIEKATEDTVGLTIEPLKHYLDKLPNKPKCIKINSAISTYDGHIDMYSIHPDVIEKYNFPFWVKGLNSINHYHPQALYYVKNLNLNKDEIFSIDKVEVMQFKTLINKYHITGCQYLKVDTEGHDHVILNNYLDLINNYNQNLLADKILFESNFLSDNNEITKLIQRFSKFGYQILHQTPEDTLLYRPV